MITIVVQSFNRPYYLRECMERLGRFLFGNVEHELILADDASTDDETPSLLKEYESRFGAQIVMNPDRQKYPGPGYILNKANELAKGDFIFHVEDDFHILRTFSAEDMEMLRWVFENIENLGLVRLRDINVASSAKTRLQRLQEDTERSCNVLGRGEFCLYKRRVDGGPPYQYTGNAHMRLPQALRDVPYAEDKSPWQMENNLAGRFAVSKYRSGTFRKGWFDHRGEITTLGMDPRHLEERKTTK